MALFVVPTTSSGRLLHRLDHRRHLYEPERADLERPVEHPVVGLLVDLMLVDLEDFASDREEGHDPVEPTNRPADRKLPSVAPSVVPVALSSTARATARRTNSPGVIP